MPTPRIEDSITQVTRDPDVINADQQIVARWLRKRCGVTWSEDQWYGTVDIGNQVWYVHLDYREKYDTHRFRMWHQQKHSSNIARRHDIAAAGPYVLVNEVLAVFATLRLLVNLDLDNGGED